MTDHDPGVLPSTLVVPSDDGAADHLLDAHVPHIALASTDGRDVFLDVASRLGKVVVYAYPRTGRPGVPATLDWDAIPGARGCTPETCGFRDHHRELASAGAQVFGLSTQHTDYQREAVERLRLPFPLLSDAGLRLTDAWRLPTFTVAGEVLLKRLTLVVHHDVVEHVFYPVFPPDAHASEVLAWLRAR